MIHEKCASIRPTPGGGTCIHCGTRLLVSYKVCSTCSEWEDLCQVCGLPMDSSEDDDSDVVKPGVFFVVKGDKDNGCSVNLRIGEQLHATLSAGGDTEWAAGEYGEDVLSLTDEGEPRMDGLQRIIFTAKQRGTAKVELVDIGRGTGSSKWKCSVNVK